MATIIATPIVHCPLKLFDGYILPQIGAGAIGIGIAVIFGTILSGVPVGPVSFLALLWFVYLMMSGAWSTVPHNSLRDVPLIFLSVFAFQISALLFENPENMVLVSLAVFFASNVLGIYAIGQRFCLDPIFPERLVSKKGEYEGLSKTYIPKCFQNKNFRDSRAIATIGNTNFATGYFLSTLPFLAYLTFAVSSWFGLSFIPVIGAVVAAECRAGQLGLFVAGLFFILCLSSQGIPVDWLMWIFDGGDNIRIGIFIVGCVSAFWVIWAFGFWLRDRGIFRMLSDETDTMNTMLDFEGRADNTMEDRQHWVAHIRYRLRYWKSAWHLIKKRPLQGFGLRTYRKEVYQAQGELNLKDSRYMGPAYQTPQPRECHNDFLENFVEGGFVGGLLFLVIVGIVLWHLHGFMSGAGNSDFLMASAVGAGFMAILVDAFFFFPLRLASSGLLFWISLGLLEGMTGNIQTMALPYSPWITVFASGAITAMVWEGTIKPNVGNYFFSCYNFSKDGRKKERYLMQAAKWCPRETIYRTHLMIGYLHTYPDEADQHAEVMREHFDGMTPGWICDFNSGMAAIKVGRWDAALRYLQQALFHLPYMDEAKAMFKQVWPKAPFQRRINLKQLSQEAMALLSGCMNAIKGFQGEIQKQELIQQNVILTEKVRMGIPPDWLFDGQANLFVPPDQVPAGKKIVELAPCRLQVLVPENAVIK